MTNKDDLISRKALIEDLMEEIPLAENTHIFKDIIENQPAAFDKEKVLAEMRSEYTDATNMYIREKGTAYAFSSEVKKDTWEKAIEIVKKSGIE